MPAPKEEQLLPSDALMIKQVLESMVYSFPDSMVLSLPNVKQ